jgi:DNA-binding NarL/FixJ family response regulator
VGNVVAWVDNLFFQAKILETAKQTGVPVEIITSKEKLIEAAGREGEGRPKLLLVDLNVRGGAIETLERLQKAGNPAPVIAFLSHVQVELAERARTARCAEVIPRSKFSQHLAQILSRAKVE